MFYHRIKVASIKAWMTDTGLVLITKRIISSILFCLGCPGTIIIIKHWDKVFDICYLRKKIVVIFN